MMSWTNKQLTKLPVDEMTTGDKVKSWLNGKLIQRLVDEMTVNEISC
jgi:hypothetical protein